LSALLAAAALTAGAVAFGELLSGEPLAYAWAGEAAALAWLSRRVREVRYQLYALGYLAMATAHAIALDAPPSRLFVTGGHIGTGAVAVLVVAVAAAIFGAYARRWRDEYDGLFSRFVGGCQGAQAGRRQRSCW